MLSPELYSKIRKIEIETRRLLSGTHVGDYSTARKGAGYEFDQICDYEVDDDVRFIDWNSSARTGSLQVRQYLEERNRTVVLALDISQSTFFGSAEQFQNDLLTQVAGVLALVADYGKDSVGLLLFSDVVELYIPPSRGRIHVHRIMQYLFSTQPQQKKTNISVALEHLIQQKKNDSLVLLLSDFVDDGFDTPLRVATRLYDIIALRCLDPIMKKLPPIGQLAMYDPETGEDVVVDTDQTNYFLHNRLKEQNKLFKQNKIDVVDLEPNKAFISDIVRFFRRRMMY